MAKTWVLDTETKGTGAHVVPLDKVQRTPAREPALNTVRLRRDAPRKPAPAPEPRRPRRFKVVDVLSQQVLAEGAGTRATLELLRDVRSVVDIHISVWQPKAQTWRPLTLGEQRALWDARGS